MAVDVDVSTNDAGPGDVDPDTDAPRERRRSRRDSIDVEIEREVTKRHLIEAITSVVVVVLYMAFTLFRDRDTGVVVLDDDRADDDWEES